MTLTERIEEMKAKTKAIIEQHPEIDYVAWEIKDVPYNEFDSYRKMLNESIPEYLHISETSCGGKLFYHAARSYEEKTQIVIWSVPLKVKHTYEVIEN